jgi:hypothetical protein
LLLLSLGPSRLCRFSGLLFALFVCESFGRPFAALATQLYGGWVLLFGHEMSIAASTGELNDQKVPLHNQKVPVQKRENCLDVCPALGIM